MELASGLAFRAVVGLVGLSLMAGCSLVFDSDSHTSEFGVDAGPDGSVDASVDAPADAPVDGPPPPPRDGGVPDGGPGCAAPLPATGDFATCPATGPCALCSLAFAGGHEFGTALAVIDVSASAVTAAGMPPALVVATVTLDPPAPSAQVRRLTYNPMTDRWMDGVAVDLESTTPLVEEPGFADIRADAEGRLHATLIAFDMTGEGHSYVGLVGGALVDVAGPVFATPFSVGGGGTVRHGWAGFLGEQGFFASSDERGGGEILQTDRTATPGIVDGSEGPLMVTDSSDVGAVVWNAVGGGAPAFVATPARTGEVAIAWGGGSSYVLAWPNEGQVILQPIDCSIADAGTTCCQSTPPMSFGAPGTVTTLDVTGMPGGGYALAVGLDLGGSATTAVRFFSGDLRAVLSGGDEYITIEDHGADHIVIDVDGTAVLNPTGSPAVFYGVAALTLDEVGNGTATAAIFQGSCSGGPP